MSGETMQVYFLGTAGALPSPLKNPACLMVRRGADTLLFDCGEGAQQQMMRARTGFTVDAIFITHWHADHFLGVFGLVQTLSFMGRTEPLTIYGPEWVHEFAEDVRHMGKTQMRFVLKSEEVLPGMVVPFDGYTVRAFKTRHGITSVGYVLEEDPRPGRFDREEAIRLGVKPGPLFGRLQRGEEVLVTVDGQERIVRPEQVVGVERPGRKVIYTGDTRPVIPAVSEIGMDADLLVHDATYNDTDLARAKEVFHATAGEAADVARAIRARTLALIHISSRYTASTDHLADAKQRFDGEVIAPVDLTMIEIPFRDA
jgi:ribonuclease Z